MNRTRKRWAAAIGAAFLLASLTTGASAAAGSATRGGLGVTEQGALPFGLHAPSAAERRALPAALRYSVTAVSGPWFLPNRNSNKDMEVYHSQTQNGALVDQYYYNGTKTQQWMLTQPSSCSTCLQLLNVNSSKCLDNSGTLANGTQMKIWQCSDTNHNQWFWINSPADCSSSGCFNFGPWSGGANGKCVEVYHSSLADYAPVDEWDCNGTKTQEWYKYSP